MTLACSPLWFSFRTSCGAQRGAVWRPRSGRSSTCRVPLRSIFSFTLGCACRTYPPCASTSICTGRRGAASRHSSHSGATKPRTMSPIEFEIPTVLAERLQVYRNEIAPAVIGKRPDAVFVTFTGKPRTQAAIKVAIERTVLRHLGVKITPHQFRHLAAKIDLDANPGAYELVRQLLGHKNLKTTTNYYAGIDTRRAGRAHAELIMKLREIQVGPGTPVAGHLGRERISAMRGPEPRLHLPYGQWPAADRLLWERAMGSDDDPFADAAGARLAKASQHNYLFAWRRFLGFLAIHEPTALELAPAERLTIERVRSFRCPSCRDQHSTIGRRCR